MAKWLNDLYKEYAQEELEEDLTSHFSHLTSPVIGGLYFGSLKALNESKPNKPLHFIVLRKIGEYYECLKVSDWHHFATDRDVIINLGTMTVIVESDVNFYLTEDEINRFALIDNLSNEISKIKKFRDGKSVDIRKGYAPMSRFINLGDYKDIRDVFKDEEFKQVKEYHLRVFELLCDE